MANELIESLKVKQEALEKRHKQLLERFLPFRAQVIDGLEAFVEEALKNNIYGVSKFKRQRDTKELVEVITELNYLDLVIISTDDVNKLELDKEELAAKIFFYSAGDEEHTPLMEIAFIETLDDNPAIRAQWFSMNGPKLFFKGRVNDPNIAGRMVQTLLNHFYVWEYTWQEKPTMRAARGKESSRPFGLIPE